MKKSNQSSKLVEKIREIMQIIAGKYKNRVIVSPKGEETRPTSNRLRETLFNICQTYVEDTHFLDLFAGSGAVGLEALSRGAKQATFVDKSKFCVKAIEETISSMKVSEKVEVLYGDVFPILEKLIKQKRQYDIIYADPPYDAIQIYKGEKITFSALVVRMVDESDLLKAGGDLFIEESMRSQPLLEGLKSLELKSSRKMGRSTLLQYVKRGAEDGV